MKNTSHLLPKLRIVFFFLFLISLSYRVPAQQSYVPAKENIEARKWFEEARFGLFIHWGVYSILGDGEWVMNNQNIPVKAYEKLPSFFYPVDFDAEEWVRTVKDAGMKYITITSRHHDGFSMFDTGQNDYNIVNGTPYGKDVLKMLTDACHKEGIRIFYYYSLLDWHNDDYYPRGKTGNKIPGREKGNWEKYIAFMKAQLTELLTNYGEVAGIWFDGHWDQMIEKDGNKILQVDWHYDEIYKLIHDLQPQCLIGNNHHQAVIPGEDFQMFERDLPGENTTGWGTEASDVGNLPKEVCETINGSWGFNLQDTKHKSDKELIHYLIKAAGYGSNLLLNVGPMPNGKIQPEHITSLKKMGNWLQNNGETIYGTQAGPYKPTSEVAYTLKDDLLFVHVLDPELTKLEIKDFGRKVKGIKMYHSQLKLKFKQNKKGILFEIPKDELDMIDTIIEIQLKSK